MRKTAISATEYDSTAQLDKYIHVKIKEDWTLQLLQYA